MQLLLGKPIADELLTRLKKESKLGEKKPGLAVILVGDDPASHLYVGLKEKAAESIGMYFECHLFLASEKLETLLERIEKLNHDPNINGIIVQLPLPHGFDQEKIIASIDPKKDADGFQAETLKRYFGGEQEARPVFPRAVARLIESAEQTIAGEKGIALVNSEFFGKVMERVLHELGLETTGIVQKDGNFSKEKLKEARVIVSACGIPNLIDAALIAPGAIIIDGGITRVGDEVVGDVNRASLKDTPGFLAPVPGGVGPLTVAFLLERTVELAEREKI